MANVKVTGMPRFALFAFLLLLTACATPRERCISGATEDIRVLDRLIAQSRGTIERGYALDTERRTNWQWVICGRNSNGAFRYCWQPYDSYRRVPTAVNLNEEQQRLESMIVKRKQLAAELGPKIAACEATFPAN